MNLAAGLLIIVVGGIHIVFGERQPVLRLKELGAEASLVGTVRIMSLQGGALLLAIGLAHVLIFAGVLQLTGAAAGIPLGLVCLNLAVFLVTAAVRHPDQLRTSGVQLVLFAAIITLQVLALR